MKQKQPTIIKATQELKIIVEKLVPNLRIAFAIHCAERAISSYEAWALGEGKDWAKPDILKEILDLCWQTLENEARKNDLRQFETVLTDLTPDTEIFPDASGSGALDAACAVGSAFDSVLNPDNLSYIIYAIEHSLFASDNLIDLRDAKRLMSTEEEEIFEAKRLNDETYPLAREYKYLVKLANYLRTWKDLTISRKEFSSKISK